MFARPASRHHQIAYVTNDLDRATALFQRDFGVPGFFVFSNVETGAAAPGDPQLRIALAHVGGVEIEVIKPLGAAPMFSDALGDGPAFRIAFHHVAIRIDGTIADWEAHARSIDTEVHPVAFRGGLGDDLRFFYTDERARIGHYIEHVWMSPPLLAQLGAVIPCYPVPRPTT